MPYPFSILQNEIISAPAQDVETFIHYALGQHFFIIEKQNLDETNRWFKIHFYQRNLWLERYMDDGKIGKIYWGGVEIIEWSDSTEIVRMWASTPEDWYLGQFGLDIDKEMEKRFGWLEELSNEIQDHFKQSTSKKQIVTQASSVNYTISISNSTIHGNVVAAENIQDSFNVIEKAEIKDDLKEQLKQLAQAVEVMIKELPRKKAEEAADDMKRLAEEVTKPSPNKKWYSVSIKGLIKAAENVGKVGEPVIKLAGKVLATLAGM